MGGLCGCPKPIVFVDRVWDAPGLLWSCVVVAVGVERRAPATCLFEVEFDLELLVGLNL